jgi:hypothetical protein
VQEALKSQRGNLKNNKKGISHCPDACAALKTHIHQTHSPRMYKKSPVKFSKTFYPNIPKGKLLKISLPLG